MKNVLPIIVFSVVLVSCDRKETPIATPEPTPTATPEPTPIATPEPTPTATPEPTPQVRLAPSGTLYVIKHFSVATDTGLHGFPIGREVTIVSENASSYSVSDGTQTGTAPKTSFSNDLDVVENLLKKKVAITHQLQAADEARLIQKKAAIEAAATTAELRTVEKRAQYKSRLLAQLPSLRARETELWAILGPRYAYRGHNRAGWVSADDNARLAELGRVKGKIKRVELELEKLSAQTSPVHP